MARVRAPARPALVVGRAQVLDDATRRRVAAEGWRLLRRASGGGAVLLEPDAQVWVDLVITADDPLWDDDVGRSTWWVGEAWRNAVVAVGVDGATVHRGGVERRGLGARVCFAGLGPGEVVVGGRKLVGIAQRRTRAGARFECAALLEWRPVKLASALGVAEDLAGCAVGLRELDPGLDASAVTDALRQTLDLA